MMKPPFPDLNTCTLAVIGLGYVGLPLAVELSKPQDCSLSLCWLMSKPITLRLKGALVRKQA